MMLTGLADWLRNAGLRVEEIAGWQDRGHGEVRNDAGLMVVVNHHTAGGSFGRAPSLSTCIYGVPGVPGPLCNVMQSREPDGNDVFIIIAAGNSYNAGTGGFAGVSGNFSTVGLECEHTGVDPYPDNRAALSQRFDAAVLAGLGQSNGARSCQHFEWSDTGKPDIGSPRVDANAWRAAVTAYMHGGGPAPAPTPRSDVIYKEENGKFWEMGLGDFIELPQRVGLGAEMGGKIVNCTTQERIAMGLSARAQSDKFMARFGFTPKP
jgi:hypothetical protein